MRPLFLSLVLLSGASGAASPGPARLLKDLTPGFGSPGFQATTAGADIGNEILFCTNERGVATLWASDGSAVREVAAVSGIVSEIIAFRGRAVFASFLPEGGLQLWRSDGSAAGTVALKSFDTFQSSSVDFLEYAGSLYFTASDAAHGAELWKTDGTAEGSILALDLSPGPQSSTPHHKVSHLGWMFFFTEDPADEFRFWRSNGTDAATNTLRSFVRSYPPFCAGPCGFGPSRPISWGSRLFFFSNDGSTGYELWSSDGTREGTWVVRDVVAGSGNGVPHPCCSGPARVGERLLFVAGGEAGIELWQTNGTADGTTLFRDFSPGPTSSAFFLSPQSGPDVLFHAASLSGMGVWHSDGTSEGTALLTNVTMFTPAARLGSDWIFAGTDPKAGLWRSDGTPAGTIRVFESMLLPILIGEQEGRFLFTADGASGLDLWAIGEQATPIDVATLVRQALSSNPRFLSAAAGQLFFFAAPNATAERLHVSDGTAEGTRPVTSANTAWATGPRPVSFGARVYYPHDDFRLGVELWTSDGTEGGTGVLREIRPGLADAAIGELVAGRGRLFFSADDGTSGNELWTSDGTCNGTQLVRDMRPGPESSYPRLLTPVGSQTFFVNFDSTWRALWRTDGTEAGTELIYMFESDTSVTEMWAFGSRVVFQLSGSEFAHDRGIWISDGTAAGTRQLLRATFAFVLSLTRNRFFVGVSMGPRSELWVSDGTEAGTRLVDARQDWSLGRGVSLGEDLLFVAYDPEHGQEPWFSNGSAEGTRLLQDVFPGSASSQPWEFHALENGLALFAATDPEHGREIWVSDGTAEGTRQVQDLAAGPLGSSPRELLRSGERVYFTAYTAETGEEVWWLPVSELSDRNHGRGRTPVSLPPR